MAQPRSPGGIPVSGKIHSKGHYDTDFPQSAKANCGDRRKRPALLPVICALCDRGLAKSQDQLGRRAEMRMDSDASGAVCAMPGPFPELPGAAIDLCLRRWYIHRSGEHTCATRITVVRYSF